MDARLAAEIVQRMVEAPRVLLLLDFDGTLAPIVPHPDQARMGAAVRTALERLAAHPRAAVGVVSARALPDVIARVGIGGIVYAGNHGLEIEGCGLHFSLPQPSLQPVLETLDERLAAFSRVWVENKSLTATVHLRGARPAERVVVERIVREVVDAAPRHRWRDAVEAIEIVPRGTWNKGSAALWIRRELGWDDALTFYAGDDGSDEDAFEALRGGITMKVGPGATKAHHSVSSPNAIWDLLASVAARLSYDSRSPIL